LALSNDSSDQLTHFDGDDPMRRTFFFISYFVLAVFMLTAFVRPVAAQHPNIMVILVDDLGYGDLSSYGATDLDTPHVDRLMSEGMRFNNFYANCPVCSPTRAALLTGRYQEAVGVPGVIRTHSRNSWGYLSQEAVLLPELLKHVNFQTAMFGKWHLGLDAPNTPTLRGFDRFQGFLGDMMDDYYHHQRHNVNYMRDQTDTIDPEGHATDLFTQYTCEYLRTVDKSKPWFIYLPYNAPHDPIQPPADWMERYREKHPDVPERRAKIAAFIEHLDGGIGQVLKALDETNQSYNTLVFFTSDNGGSLPRAANNGPLRDGKQSTFEGGVKVPMCVRYPGVVEPGSVSDQVAITMDIFPTIAELVSLPCSPELDGTSLLPVLADAEKELAPRDLVFSRLMPPGQIYALRRGSYKIVTPKAGDPTLLMFDLSRDPLEENDLREEEPERFAEMKTALDAHIARFVDVPWRDENGRGPGEIQ
jgi:arylsulfatase A-like enzyme